MPRPIATPIEMKYIPHRLYQIFLKSSLKVYDLRAAVNQSNYIEVVLKNYNDTRLSGFMTIEEMIYKISREPCPFNI